MNLYKSSVNSFDLNRRTRSRITPWKNTRASFLRGTTYINICIFTGATFEIPEMGEKRLTLRGEGWKKNLRNAR